MVTGSFGKFAGASAAYAAAPATSVSIAATAKDDTMRVVFQVFMLYLLLVDCVIFPTSSVQSLPGRGVEHVDDFAFRLYPDGLAGLERTPLAEHGADLRGAELAIDVGVGACRFDQQDPRRNALACGAERELLGAEAVDDFLAIAP